MTGSDEEFDDFLRRRRPMFGRSSDDVFEPPAELDRLVLRQAREAIVVEQPQRVFHPPRWGMPVALAATLVLAFTVILNIGNPTKKTVPEVTVQNISRQLEQSAATPAIEPAMQARSAAPSEPSIPDQSAQDGAVVADLTESASDKRELDRAAPEGRVRIPETNAGSSPSAPTAFVSEQEAVRYAVPAAAAPTRRALANEAARPSAAVANGRRAEVNTTGDLRADMAPPATAKSTTDKPAFRRDSKTWLAEIERLRAAGDIARADAEQEEYGRQHRAFAVAPDR